MKANKLLEEEDKAQTVGRERDEKKKSKDSIFIISSFKTFWKSFVRTSKLVFFSFFDRNLIEIIKFEKGTQKGFKKRQAKKSSERQSTRLAEKISKTTKEGKNARSRLFSKTKGNDRKINIGAVSCIHLDAKPDFT